MSLQVIVVVGLKLSKMWIFGKIERLEQKIIDSFIKAVAAFRAR